MKIKLERTDSMQGMMGGLDERETKYLGEETLFEAVEYSSHTVVCRS
jgi:hypothetical protein